MDVNHLKKKTTNYSPLQLLFDHKQVQPCGLFCYAEHLSYALQRI